MCVRELSLVPFFRERVHPFPCVCGVGDVERGALSMLDKGLGEGGSGRCCSAVRCCHLR